MPVIQDYTTQVTPQGGISAQATPNDFGAQIGQGAQQLGAGIGEAGDQAFKVEQDQGRIWAYEASSKQYEGLKQGFQDKVNALDPNDPGFPAATSKLTSDFSAQIDQSTQQLMDAAPSKSARRILGAYSARSSRSLLNYGMGEQARITGEYTGKLVQDGLKSDQDSLSADPSDANYNRILDQRKDMIGGLNTVDPVAKMKWQENAEHSMAVTQVQTVAATNPNGFLGAVNAQGGKTSGKGAVPGVGGTSGSMDFNTAVGHVLQSEGGYTAHDGNGQPANFGINQGANPDVDVKNLTQSGATAIYKDRYWNAIGADKLPDNMKLTAFDAAVNQGVGWTKNALAQANGDPTKFNELRTQHYKDIAANDPSKAASLPGWLNRMQGIQSASGAASDSSTNPNTPQVQPLQDGDIAAAAPPIAGWGKLTWQEKVNSVRQAEAVVGGQLASDRGKMDQDLRDSSASLLAGKPFPGVDDARFSQSNFTRLYGADQGQRKFDQFQYTKNVGGFMGQMQTMPVAQAQATLNNLEPQGGPEFADKNPVFKAANEAYARLDKVRQADPMAWAVSNGVAGAKPIDMSNAQNFMDGLHSRMSVASTVSNDYGAQSSLLSKDEVNQLTDRLSNIPATQQMGYIKAIRLGTAGNDNQFQNTLAQIAPKNTTLAQAASASVREGTVNTAGGPQDGDMVGKYILEGAHILQGKDIDDPQHTGRPMAIDDKAARNFFWNAVGPGAFQSGDAQRSSQTANDTYQAVKNYLAADVYHRGMDPKAVTQDQVTNAVTAVTGGTVRNNKGDNLFVPWGMDKSQFQQQMPARAQAVIEAAGYKGTSLDKLDAYHYVNLDDGKYGMTNGGKTLVDKTGRAVVVDFKQPFGPQQASGRVQ